MPSIIIRMLAFIMLASVTISATAATQYPLTVIDGMGNTLVLNKKPQKISSLTLFTDEVLEQLVDNSRLASMTFLASDVNYSNIADRLPKDITLLDFNVEALVGIYPDLVFAANWSEADKVAQLRDAGIPVYLVDTPTSIAGIQQEILKLAALLDAQKNGEEIVANMDRRLSDLAPHIAAIQSRGLVALDYNTWGSASGVGTTWNEILEQAGLVNAAASLDVGDYGQVSLSKETIVAVNPDLLFLPGWVYGDPAGAETFKQSVIADPALTDVSAIQNSAIFQVPEKLAGSYSQYIVEAVAYIVNAVSAAK